MKRKAIDLLNEIRMSRASNPDFTAILVEGRTDCGFLRKLTCAKSCRLYDEQKVLARQTAKLALDLKVPGVVAVVDRDHDHFLNRITEIENLIYTDQNDLEVTVIRSTAFDGFLHEYLDHDDHARILASTNYDSLAEHLLAMVGIVGVLRYLSASNNWDLRFRDLNVTDAFDLGEMRFNLERLVGSVHGASTKARVSKSEAIRELRSAVESIANIADYATGHDATRLLALLLSSKTWVKYELSVEPMQIERELRLCFTGEFFRSTEMFDRLSAWEQSSAGFMIFPREVT